MNYRDHYRDMVLVVEEDHHIFRWLIKLTETFAQLQEKPSTKEILAGIILTGVLFIFFGAWGFIAAIIAFLLRELLLGLVIELLIHIIVRHWRLEK